MAGRGKGAHVPPEMLLMGVRCSGASPWRYRHGEDRREERGGPLDHATIPRGVVPDRPPVAAALHRRKRPVWVSGRLDETSRRSQGQGESRERAVAPTGPPIDGLLTQQRAERAANRVLTPAILYGKNIHMAFVSRVEGAGASEISTPGLD